MKGYIGLFILSIALCSYSHAHENYSPPDHNYPSVVKIYTLNTYEMSPAVIVHEVNAPTATFAKPVLILPQKSTLKSVNLQTFHRYAVRAVGGARKQIASGTSNRTRTSRYVSPVGWQSTTQAA